MSLRTDIITSFKAATKDKQKSMVSSYMPKGKERSRLADVSKDYGRADTVRNKPYEEFEYKSLTQIMNRDRRRFNNYVGPDSGDPDESWRANTIRPITRNKVISIAAHTTSSLMFPNVFAQNDKDQEDKAAGMVMRDLNQWSIDQSSYASDFVKAVIKALVDPAMVMYEGYSEVKRKIKEIQEDGSWKEKDVEDEIYSGFQSLIVPIEEFYIANAYEGSIQKQPFVIWRKVIDYEDAKAKYGDNAKFKKYVEPGLKIFYSEENDGFYQMYDKSLEGSLVEEVIYYNRFADLELRIINGVLIDDPDRPMQRKDKMYPFSKTGYEYFAGTDFFYYKSLVDKMSSDQTVIDTLYNMVIDGTFLQIMPPSVVLGDEEIDSSVIVPGGITTMSEDTKFQTINTNNNLNAGMNMLTKTEASASESSTDPSQSGQQTPGTPPTAFEVSRLEANAKTILGLFGKMISEFVRDFGKLRINTILQYMTVAQGMEIVGDSTRLQFRNFLVNDPESKDTRKIEFDIDTPTTPEEAEKESFNLLKRELDEKMSICKVNPELFRRNKYMIKVEPDFMPIQSEAVKKALQLEAYDRLIQNPYVDHKKVTADFLIDTYKPGDADKYLQKTMAGVQAEANGQTIANGNSNVTSQILNNNEAGAMR